MADLAVGAALTLLHDVVYLLNKEVHFSGNLKEEVEMRESWCRSMLAAMQAAISESEGHDLTELQKSRVNEVRRVAYEIEEVLDEFTLHAPHKFHRHEIVNIAHDLAHNIWHRKELHDLSSKMEKIKKKMKEKMDCISFINLLLHGPHHTSSGLRPEDQVAHIKSDDELVSKILLISYMDLPDNLRRCFLYFSIFPEDYNVEREKLIRLWVSGQFVTEAEGKTVEEVAEDYLNELVRRNLITVTRRDFDGRVRSCRVQNLELEFIVQKSKDDNFVSVLSKSSSTPSPAGEKIRHLAVHQASTTLSEPRNFESVRSALFFRWDGLPLAPRTIKDFLRHCKFIRVLDLQDAPISEFPEDIVSLRLLRYLSLRNTKIKTIPSSIKKLSFLETLDLKKTEITQLPKEIVYLRNLRHLLVDNHTVKTSWSTFGSVQGVAMVAGIVGLVNLQKLSLLKPDKFGKIINELGSLTQLRKLGIVQLKEEYGKDLCASIGKMKNLTTLDVSSTSKEHYLKLEKMHEPPCCLQRVYLKGRLQKLPDWILTLSNLFRVQLMWSKLQVSPVESLQFLPNLIELQMVDAYSGTELVFKTGSFRKLKTLAIEQFDELQMIVIQEGAMPELQKLSLVKCEKSLVKCEKLTNIGYLTRVEELLLYAMQDELVNQV